MHEPEDAREHGTILRATPRPLPAGNDNVLDTGRDDRHGNQEFDQLRRQRDCAADGKCKRHGMADGESADDPEGFPPVAWPIDGGQSEQEEKMVHRLQISDVPEAKLNKGEEVLHYRSVNSSREW